MAVTKTYSLTTTLSEAGANSYISYDQTIPDVLGLSNGGYAVSYVTTVSSKNLVMLDFFDATGNIIGTFKTPYDGISDAVGSPSLTELSNGNVLVTWVEGEPNNERTIGRLFSPTGTEIGSEIALSAVSPLYLSSDDIALFIK